MTSETSGVYRACRGVVRFLLRLFFREVEVEGLENLPRDRGGLLVAAHPNGLVDPAVILSLFPGRIVFGARHGLFSWPLVGWLIKRVGTVPIYRASDVSGLSVEERRQANEQSLDGLARELAQGSFSALFPEGLSHDLPHLAEVKTGAARLYYRARALRAPGSPAPAIIPVGLYYDRKSVFRSRVLVSFQPALALPPDLELDPNEDEPPSREAIKGLTGVIDQELARVVGATEDWQLHHLMHRARKLVRAELAWRGGEHSRKPGLAERRLGYDRIWRGYQARKDADPSQLAEFRRRISRYDRHLRLLGLDDHELSSPPRMASPLRVALFVGQMVAVYLLIPPVLVLGALVNVGPYFLLKWFNRKVSKARKDEATVKLMGGLVLFPLVWTAVAVAAWFVHEEFRTLFPGMPDLAVLVVLLVLAVEIVGGYLALIYSELSAGTYRAVRVRLMQRRRAALVAQLAEERSQLADELLAFGEGLDLPGRRLPDGSLVKDSQP